MPDADRLAGVHPELVAKLARVLDAMRVLGFPMMVTDGVRTAREQLDLWRQGRTSPGRIVTNADGMTRRSPHQAHEDGYGRAVDCAFIVDGRPSWSDDLPWNAYGELARALGLRWGVRVSGFIDRPHVELPLPAPPSARRAAKHHADRESK